MPTIRVAPEAASELRRRIHRCGVPNTFVVIVRLNKGADLSRGTEGEVVWAVERDSISWSCEVIALPENETFSSIEVEGIRFAFSTVELAKINRVEVTLRDGEPNADVDA